MKDYQKILVVADPTSENQIALARAIRLADKNQAEVTIFLSIFDFSYEMTSILSQQERESMRQSVITQRQTWLDEQLTHYPNTTLTINTQVIWHNRPFESIIRYAIDGNYDLIIKGTHIHDKLKAVIFTPTDWHLMRKAPMPVLMVKEQAWPEAGNIICAVNIASNDVDNLQLNDDIIAHAQTLAHQFTAQIHLVNGYPGTPVNLAIELPDFDTRTYNDAIRLKHEQGIIQLAKKHGIPPQYCHVKEGLPEDVITELTQKLNAELVILGTVGRTGLSAALIGNTAEHVIDNISCDLLAIKPHGYRSPLEEA